MQEISLIVATAVYESMPEGSQLDTLADNMAGGSALISRIVLVKRRMDCKQTEMEKHRDYRRQSYVISIKSALDNSRIPPLPSIYKRCQHQL